MQAYKNNTLEKGQEKPFKEIVDESLEVLGEIEESTGLPRFNPGSSVDRQKAFGIVTYQDFGVVDQTDFLRLTGLTPAQAGKQPYQMLLNGMEEKPEELYLLHLRGLDVGEILSMRKTRVYFSDETRHDRCYLQPHQQVVKDQGKFVFEYVFKMFQADQPCHLNKNHMGKQSVVETVQQLQDRHAAGQ